MDEPLLVLVLHFKVDGVACFFVLFCGFSYLLTTTTQYIYQVSFYDPGIIVIRQFGLGI